MTWTSTSKLDHEEFRSPASMGLRSSPAILSERLRTHRLSATLSTLSIPLRTYWLIPEATGLWYQWQVNRKGHARVLGPCT